MVIRMYFRFEKTLMPILIGFALTILPFVMHAQSNNTDSLTASETSLFTKSVGLSLQGTSGKAVPFWMRSNQYGSVPLSGASASAFAQIGKDYSDKSAGKLVDWGGNIDLRFNGGRRAEVIPVEAYVKGRLGIFQLKVGRSRDREGINDSLLSSGSFTLSGNALGIPKAELAIPEYYTIPFTDKLFAFKGNASFGLMGDVPIQYGDSRDTEVATKFHHLSFYARLGRPESRWKLYAAIHHDVIWGSDKAIFGDQYDLSWTQELWHVVSGKAYAPPRDFSGRLEISKVGNHLGAIDFGAEYQFNNVKVNVYRQFFYEKGAIAHYANLKDGLTGIVFTNSRQENSAFRWNKILAEFFYSKSQAGDFGAKKTPSGPEYYYNHAVYPEGFSYNGLGLGTPLIIPAKDARSGNVNHPLNYFISTRVVAGHLGGQFLVNDWSFLTKITFARHYGDYRTSGPDEQWFNGIRIPQEFNAGKFTEVNQFSGYIEGGRELFNRIHVSGGLAVDYGKLLNNNLGGFIKVHKSF